ncbi:SMI1/KNR4 family protein [Sphingomonas sp. LY160]|uniref:SMI1/KNR4 family protein n=1 Tax=Sphingomonas sp. LY160 TaxID=3095342 RepID=UPI002ADEC2D1|nr:SMI1/KNR4 family protein [Sphingomonas sp. LY160]MEA1072177.1 SMI1/KNR4 family protein [Sphingomonas sp. LY160]
MDSSRRRLLIGSAILGALAVGGALPTLCAMRQMKTGKPLPDGKAPARPAGQPMPLIEEDIAPVLARLDAWYAAHLDPAQYVFNPPATDAQIDAFERLVGLTLPKSYRQLYRWHDGEDDDRWGHIYGLPIESLRQAASDWTAWNETIAEFGGNRYIVPASSWPAGTVDPAYANPRWIPLTLDGSGNHIGLDFDPWPGGRVGQVILYGRDEDVKVVLAPSLGAFLGWIADLLEGGNFRLDAPPGAPPLRLFRLKTPTSDGFHDGARKLLGAPGPFL